MQKQAALHDLARCCHELSKACHAAAKQRTTQTEHKAFAPTPSTAADRLAWIRALAAPSAITDTHPPPSMLIILHEPTTADSPIPETDTAKREAAFNLARQLPYFDRSLTAYYLSSPNLARNELDLHVAHSILRLTPPSTTLQEFLTNHFPFWRTQGLLHVLALAAANMPSAERDWGLTPRGAEPVQTLLDAIAAARSPLEVARAVTVFQANAPSSSSATDMAAFTETLKAPARGTKQNKKRPSRTPAAADPGQDSACTWPSRTSSA